MNRLALLMALAACGGGHHASTLPPATASARTKTIGLVSSVAHQAWYRAPARCGQGPYDIVIPATSTKWGEQVDLMLHTQHGVALHAVLLVDGVEVAHTDGTFDGAGSNARLDNTRCLADKRERVAAGRGGGGASGGTPGTRVTVGVQVPSAPSTTAQLELDTEPVIDSTSLITFRLKQPAKQIVVRLWSVEPNDFDGVRIGTLKLAWRPNVSEAEYEAYLVKLEADRVAEIERQAAERARAIEAERLRQEANIAVGRERTLCRLEAERRQRGVVVPDGSPAHVELCRAVAAEDEARRHDAEVRRLAMEEARRRAELDRPRREAEERRARERARAERERGEEEARRRAHELEISAQREAESLAELDRRREAEIAAERERKRKREQFCASHPNDRDCWGPGGMKVQLELEQRRREREQFCVDHKTDVRCWTDAEWQKHRHVWQDRVAVALAPPKPPEGPPPSPLVEEQPPKLSVHAEWRPGYWHWLDAQWVWLAGQWNVPQEDIVAEQTTTAPDAPPPLRVEAPPPAPVRSAVWLAGFWQWNGTSWVWIAGSYQLRPPQMTWRAPEWRARGSVHVLVPGGWIRFGGSR